MRRRSAWLLAAVAAASAPAGAVVAFAGGQPSLGSGTSVPKPGVYTFQQAVQAGIVPSLEQQLRESGLPLCPPASKGTGGYASPAALEAAIAKAPEAPTCVADPRQTTISVCCTARPHPCAAVAARPKPAPTHPGTYSATGAILVASPMGEAGVPVPPGFRFPDSPSFWRALGRTSPRISGEAFLARLAYSKPVRTLALAPGELRGAYLVEPPSYAPRGRADADPWGGASVRITGYAAQPSGAMQIADRITGALCRFIVAHTPRTLTGEQRFQPEPLPAFAAKRVQITPARARRI